MAFHRDHRHNPSAPVGMILLKLALGVGAAILKKKFVDKIASKPPAPAGQTDRNASIRNEPDRRVVAAGRA